MEEYTSVVTGYISKYIDDVTTTKIITTRPRQKPWITTEVRALLKARDTAYREGEEAALRKARAELSQAIKSAKRTHAQKIHNHFMDINDSRRLWQGIQAITNYMPAPITCDGDGSLPEALNQFYSRFEEQNGTVQGKPFLHPMTR